MPLHPGDVVETQDGELGTVKQVHGHTGVELSMDDTSTFPNIRFSPIRNVKLVCPFCSCYADPDMRSCANCKEVF